MRTVQLRAHKHNLTNKQELLLSTKEFPDFEIGDVVEIYHPEEEYSRLLLQITTLPDDFQQKDVVSVEQAIATAFQLKTYQNVIVNKVDKKAVRLDLVEVLFKEQYFSRSDMHRMRSSMIGTCVYLNKKLESSEMRAHVNELWSKGEKVTCGVISDDTRIVFRSSTAVVQIFIQMSTEMWDFDINGDLYFEKAVDGFLTDLYAKWKEHNCCHDVTIVMFSRTFYEAHSRDEFPMYMQECLQQDFKGRFYEDFYRVVVQNERYDEWTGTIKQLRKLFNEYRKRVLSYHKRPGYKVPKAYNSTAAQGNFLETLNMTLNLFEKYYLDRNLDRTGKVAVVITPGAGVFEVDRELTNITKQRTIDCGVGSDLVCMGEQPLHAAPLFKFHSKNSWGLMEVGDDYNIPHWMNHSFYTSKNQIQFYSNKTFVPRIKMPPEIVEKKKPKEPVIEQNISYTSDDDNFPFVDYDEYDAQVFKLPSRNNCFSGGGRSSGSRSKKKTTQPQTFQEAKLFHVARKRNISDDVSCMPIENLSSSPNVSIPTVSSGDDLSSSLGCNPFVSKGLLSGLADSDNDLYLSRPVVGSAGSPIGHRKFLHNYRRHRALINPFAPSRMQFKTTSNRRRWVHIFPIDPHGAAVQTHHVHMYMDNPNKNDRDECEPTPEVIQAAELAVQKRKEKSSVQVKDRSSLDTSGYEDTISQRTASPNYKGYMNESRNSSFLQKQKSFLWGATGEQEWTPELTTGQDWWPLEQSETNNNTESRLIKPILTADFENTQTFCAGIRVDWKSLNMPASLPITTDYLPDKTSLQNDYVVSDYSLLPDDVNSDYYMNLSASPPLQEDDKLYRKHPLTTKEVFNELISQRLAQGFQLIILQRPPSVITLASGQGSVGQRSILGTSPQISSHHSLKRARPRNDEKEVYLSIGRIFHKLTLSGRTITVTRYRPRHPNPQMCYSYKYRFQAPDSYDYNVSWSEFRNEKLENYNWNYLDQYICTRGEGDYGLMESLKFWRSRYFILPCNNPATKKIIEGHQRCDIYEEKTHQELKGLISGMARYLEILNKMKRTAITRTTHCKHTEFLAKNPGGIPQPDTRPDEEVLATSSPSPKIVSWMVDPECGIPMLPKQRGLPAQCFISAEIVDWCYIHVKGVKGVQTAMEMLQRVLDDGLIVHASGNRCHRMIYGFYLYTFVTKDQPAISNPLFQNDWSEVAMLPVLDDDNEGSRVKFGLDDQSTASMEDNPEITANQDWKVMTGLDKSGQTWAQQSATQLHKYVNVEVDPMSKSDRPEWSTARYHAYYSPRCSFELQVQWMVATGCILAELITNWSRKAGSCGFHVIPVPIDPFALPSAPDSDPLRGPIYVPLNIRSIDPTGGSLFPGYDKETKYQKMLQFQEAIIQRFGFMPSSVRIPNKGGYRNQYSSITEEYQQFVHCTGGMFIILEDTRPPQAVPEPPTSKLQKTSSSKELKSSGSFTKKSSSEQRKDYIARQTSQTFSPAKEDVEVGFLWSWNFMSSKRWRTGNTGDEHFQDMVLKDFRAFCSNDDNRLADFWTVYTDS